MYCVSVSSSLFFYYVFLDLVIEIYRVWWCMLYCGLIIMCIIPACTAGPISRVLKNHIWLCPRDGAVFLIEFILI